MVRPGAEEASVRWHHLACDPVEVVRGESLAEVERAWQTARKTWQAGPDVPIAVGFVSYDLGRRFERLRGTPPPPSGWPLLEFRFYDAFWVKDQATGVAEIWASDRAAARRLAERLQGAQGAGPRSFAPPGGEGRGEGDARFELGPFSPIEPDARHLAAVERVLDYLAAGDAYQVNLARRLEASCRDPGPIGLELFLRLQESAPAPFALWFADPQAGRALVGNSPERFLRLEAGDRIFTEPIKGTRPRIAGQEAAQIAELEGSQKDRAEHVMIVDLERNDLGRICRTGSVEVRDPLRVLALPRLFHLVSTVSGRLRPGVGLTEIFAACFPGGSITGAPKIRAMEIIDELEAAARGPYTGATGWLGADGGFDLAIAIRTGLLEGERLTLWAGGGVVIDSRPAEELEETRVKIRAFEAVRAAAARQHDES